MALCTVWAAVTLNHWQAHCQLACSQSRQVSRVDKFALFWLYLYLILPYFDLIRPYFDHICLNTWTNKSTISHMFFHCGVKHSDCLTTYDMWWRPDDKGGLCACWSISLNCQGLSHCLALPVQDPTWFQVTLKEGHWDRPEAAQLDHWVGARCSLGRDESLAGTLPTCLQSKQASVTCG